MFWIINISLSAEPVFHVGTFVVSNSLIATLVSSFLLVLLSIFIFSNLKTITGKTQNIVEMVVEYMDSLNSSIGGKTAKVMLPIILTYFFFIFTSNWIALILGFNAIGFYEHIHGEEHFVPLLRAATADINTTPALAIISFFLFNIMVLKPTNLVIFINS